VSNKNSASKRLAEEMRKAATIRAYVKAMAEKGVVVKEVEWGPADPHKRTAKNTETISTARYTG
jgi:hypothetical protein